MIHCFNFNSRLLFGAYDQEAWVCVLLRWWLGRYLSRYDVRSVGAAGQAKTCRAHDQTEGHPHLRAAVTLSSCWQGTWQQDRYCYQATVPVWAAAAASGCQQTYLIYYLSYWCCTLRFTHIVIFIIQFYTYIVFCHFCRTLETFSCLSTGHHVLHLCKHSMMYCSICS